MILPTLRLPLAFTVALSLLCCGRVPAALSPEDFRHPPIQSKPAALWTWLNGHVDHQQITRELEEMQAKGMRGAIIWDLGSIADPDKIIPAGPEFLGPESLKSIHHAMDEAQRLGLELGLVASSSWNAGGTWITPPDASKELRWSELRVQGPSQFSAILPLPEKTSQHQQTVAVLAVPEQADKSISGPNASIRLDPQLAADGRLTWSVPDGVWHILRFVCNNTGEILNCPSPNSRGLVIDHLSGQAADAHFNHMLDTLSKGRSGFGSLKLLMLDSYEVHPATDWTPEFIKAFVAHNNYDPTPWLPVLAGWTIGSKELSDRFQHDYHKTVSDLLVEEHFIRARELLHQRGLLLLAEAGHGGHARVDPLKALGAADIPMGEFWNHRKNWVTKEAASAAHIYGKPLVNSESFTGWQNWQDGPAAYKRLFDIALCAGLNQVTFHTFAHNPPSAGLPGFAYHAGEHFNVNSTWWNQTGPLLADMARCCHLLQQGQFVADVCVYYGDDAPNLVPARRIAPTITPQWGKEFCLHCGRPLPVDLHSLGHGYDYDYINEEVLLTRMSVLNGKLVLPDGMSYRLLVLPDRKTISTAALQRIAALVEAGATVVGPKPERANSLRGFPACDQQVQELAAQIWGDCDGDKIRTHAYGKGKVAWNLPLNEILTGMGVEPDFVPEKISNDDQHMDYIHRATTEEDIYFVSNSAMERQAVRCRFRAAAGRTPSFWHPEDGSVTPCHSYETSAGFTHITIDLAPASSVFVIFAKAATQDHLLAIKYAAAPDATAAPADPQAIEILALNTDSVQANVWRPGTYQFETASGRTGKIVADHLPADQLIEGPWNVSFEKDRGAPAGINLNPLTDWTKSADPAVRYFSGAATYRNQFLRPAPPANAKTPVILDLGSVKEVATVRINGQQAAVLWKEPYRVNIAHLLRPGANQIEISVVNTWNNRIVGDLNTAPEKRITRTNLTRKFNAGSPLLPSGLLGPVILRSPQAATCDLH